MPQLGDGNKRSVALTFADFFNALSRLGFADSMNCREGLGLSRHQREGPSAPDVGATELPIVLQRTAIGDLSSLDRLACAKGVRLQ